MHRQYLHLLFLRIFHEKRHDILGNEASFRLGVNRCLIASEVFSESFDLNIDFIFWGKRDVFDIISLFVTNVDIIIIYLYLF